MTFPLRDNLTEMIFRALYPDYQLTTIGSTYVVYPPPAPDKPLMFIADSLGVIARQISALESPGIEPGNLTADQAETLPRRLPEPPNDCHNGRPA